MTCPVTLAGTPHVIRLSVDKDFRTARVSLKAPHGPPKINRAFYDDGTHQDLYVQRRATGADTI